MIKYKKYLIFAFLLALFYAGLSFAQTELEIDYPTISGVITPADTKMLLTDYVKYVFNFFLAIAGFVAFGALILGGYNHLTSGGNPSKMGDAKDQISSAIIGLIILLSSVLILNTVNPQLTTLKLDKIGPKSAIELYPVTWLIGEPQIYSIDNSLHDLSDFNTLSIKIADDFPMENIEVYIYSGKNYEGTKKLLTSRVTNNVAIDYEFIPRSILLVELKPGAYLCTEINYGGECKLAQHSVINLGSEGLEDKVKSIKFRDNGTTPIRGSIHEDRSYEGKSDILLDLEIPDLAAYTVGYNASSLIVLYINEEPYNDGEVTLCREFDCKPYNDGQAVYPIEFDDPPPQFDDDYKVLPSGVNVVMRGRDNLHTGTWPPIFPAGPESIGDGNGSGISAIEVSGNYVVFLYKDQNYIGDCWVVQPEELKNLTGWWTNNEGSSLRIIKVK